VRPASIWMTCLPAVVCEGEAESVKGIKVKVEVEKEDARGMVLGVRGKIKSFWN